MLLMEFCTIRGGNPAMILHNFNLTFKVAPTAVFSNLYIPQFVNTRYASLVNPYHTAIKEAR